jgi:hypothetical protein
MNRIALIVAAAALVGAPVIAQETKPVPKGSVRVSIPGCSKGYVFTAGPHTVETPGSGEVPEGMHLRMSAPKKMMSEIKAHEGSAIEITGLMKTGQHGPSGVGIGGGVRVSPGPSPTSGSISGGGAPAGLSMIDVESWRQVPGSCTVR